MREFSCDSVSAFREKTVAAPGIIPWLHACRSPGSVPGPDGKPMAPHISFWVVARGINIGLQTRLYFEDEAEANAADWVLNRIPSPVRRKTLIARKEAGEVLRYVFDIKLQGDNETVFFDL